MSPERGSVDHPERGYPQEQQGDKHSSVSTIPATHSIHELAAMLETLADSIRASKEGGDMAASKLANASAVAKAVYNLRRKRAEILREPAIADGPAWDILLDLFINSTHEKPVSVTSAAIGASCPLTTALRWLQILQDHDLVARVYDPADRRRRFVKLTPQGYRAVVDVLALYQHLKLPAL